MKTAALFSGGKDSCYAVWKAVKQGKEIVSLVAFSPENPDSYMFHHPNVQWTKLQAEAMDLPLKIVSTKGEKEKELEDLEKALKQLPIQGVVVGALASQYQKSRVEAICKKLGLELFSPAWGIDPDEYWKELFHNNFRVIITKVACDGLGKEWLGREINKENFQELKQLSEKFGFHLAGEGGEFETFVLDGPLFKRKIEIQDSGIEWEGDSGIFLVKKAGLI
ncbi:MAG: TIGR00289 family protein [Candidatus Aenigmarchaeota archaeon]|nr:TIGR00289 family protein [Candidatus Aenigmarchaeota archaeon]